MITPQEYALLHSSEVQAAIAACRGRDPLVVAMDRSIPHARLVATQVKYLARAETKLPSYAAAQCILPPLAFEQASSEVCARHKQISGETALDLTCGLGVDTLGLAQHFKRVVALERDPVLAAITTYNLRKLGVTNVEVLNTSAEEYLQHADLRFDWVYADPDRRSASGRKLVRLEECSPNMLALMPRIREVASGLCLKNSPLFDVDEALRLFAGCRVEVISLDGECKEVVVYADGSGPMLTATALGKGSFSAPPYKQALHSKPFDPQRYHWLIVPDAALQKARLARLHFGLYADIWSDNGYAFAVEEPHEVLGRLYSIASIEAYDPKRLRHQLKGCRVELLKRDFPLAQEELARRLGIRAGDDLRIAFTKIGNDYWVIRLK